MLIRTKGNVMALRQRVIIGALSASMVVGGIAISAASPASALPKQCDRLYQIAGPAQAGKRGCRIRDARVPARSVVATMYRRMLISRLAGEGNCRHREWRDACVDPSARNVVATVIGGCQASRLVSE